jgi:hypothetical protein
MRARNKRFPSIDDTRVWSTEARQRVIPPRGESLPTKHAYFADISPEEIEARYQQRLAEIRWLRSQGISL